MARGFLGETAAINAFARAVRAEVYVADFGMREELAGHPRLIGVNCGRGTANFALGPAIPHASLDGVLAAGAAAFDILRSRSPFDILALGEMGIANTTSAAALVAAFARARRARHRPRNRHRRCALAAQDRGHRARARPHR